MHYLWTSNTTDQSRWRLLLVIISWREHKAAWETLDQLLIVRRKLTPSISNRLVISLFFHSSTKYLKFLARWKSRQDTRIFRVPASLDSASSRVTEEDERHLYQRETHIWPSANSHSASIYGKCFGHAQRHQRNNICPDQVKWKIIKLLNVF